MPAPIIDEMSWKHVLKDVLERSLERDGDLVFVGLGNPLRGDDGIGVKIAAKLSETLRHERVKILVVEERVDLLPRELERLKPAMILFFDAADFGGKPGEIRLMSLRESAGKAISTHEIPLELVVKISGISSPTYLLGVQVKSLEFGEQVSPPVKAAGEEVIRFLQETLSKHLLLL